MEIQKCVGCGIDIEAKRSTRKWCNTCKVVRHRVYVQRYEQHQRDLRGKRVPRSTATCRVCGSTFLAFRSDANQCSTPCKRADLNRRAREFEQRHKGTCIDCGRVVARRSKRCRPCADKAMGPRRRGDNNWQWKGGRSKDRYGYVHILVAPEKRKGHRYRPEHILVWEAANGPIPEGHIVHHINSIKNDNRLENLEVISRSEHRHRHGEQRIAELEAEARALRAQLAELEEQNAPRW